MLPRDKICNMIWLTPPQIAQSATLSPDLRISIKNFELLLGRGGELGICRAHQFCGGGSKQKVKNNLVKHPIFWGGALGSSDQESMERRMLTDTMIMKQD